MLAWGIVIGLCLAFLCLGALLRQKIRALQASCARLETSLAEATQDLDSEKAHSAQQLAHNQALTAALAEAEAALSEKTAALAALTTPDPPKLYLPENDAQGPETSADTTVYYNENTGIYHADRACAPYQAVELPLSQVPSTARPCKKCAESILPAPTAPEAPPPESENQLSLFDSLP